MRRRVPAMLVVLIVAGSVAGSREAARAAAPSAFFIYGSSDAGSSLELGVLPAPGQTTTLTTVARGLAAQPVESMDGTKLALVSLRDRAAAEVATVTIVDTRSAATVSSGTLTLARPKGALLLVTPVFAGDSRTVCLVFATSVPTNPVRGSKPDPFTGKQRPIVSSTWVTHHDLAYFDVRSRAFIGPFSLHDGPALAGVNAVATGSDLYLWTIGDAAAAFTSKGSRGSIPEPQLAAYPLGSGTPLFHVSAPGSWPVDEQPTFALGNGTLARLVGGRQIEVYSAASGTRKQVLTIGPLAEGSARPAPTTLELRPDGLAFFANSAIGKAVIADSTHSFAIVSTVAFPPLPGASASAAVLSADGTKVFTLGPPKAGGLSAYDAATGSLVASGGGGAYSSLYGLPNNTLVAVSTESRQLSFFDTSLHPIGTATTQFQVDAVYR